MRPLMSAPNSSRAIAQQLARRTRAPGSRSPKCPRARCRARASASESDPGRCAARWCRRTPDTRTRSKLPAVVVLVASVEPVRILERVVEADRVGVVARALDVAAEIALPRRREHAAAGALLHPHQAAVIAPSRSSGPQPPARRNPRPCGCARRRGIRRCRTPCETVKSPRRSGMPPPIVNDPSANQPVEAGPLGPHRDHAAERIGSVRHRSRAARDVDALDHRGIHERGARSHAALGGDAAAVDQDQRASAREAAHRRHRGLPFGHLIDARARSPRPACRLAGLRCVDVRCAITIVIAAPSDASMLGATPAATVTSSLTADSTTRFEVSRKLRQLRSASRRGRQAAR